MYVVHFMLDLRYAPSRYRYSGSLQRRISQEPRVEKSLESLRVSPIEVPREKGRGGVYTTDRKRDDRGKAPACHPPSSFNLLSRAREERRCRRKQIRR